MKRRLSHLARQAQSRDLLKVAAARWAELAAARSASWTGEVSTMNREGLPVRVQVTVSYVPDDLDDGRG